MKLRVFLYGFLCAIALIAGVPGFGQALFVAPTQSDTDHIDLLLGVRPSDRTTLEARALYHYDTNVEDFARAGTHHPSPLSFHGDTGYYTSDQTQEIGISHGHWALTYAEVRAELYRGNHDAAQLYLDSTSQTINLNGTYNPDLLLDRSRAVRWRAQYTSPLRIASRPATIQLAGSFLRLARAQTGTLAGNTLNGQFHGDIDLFTTLGLPSDQISSYAASLDAALSIAVRPRTHLSLSIENLLGQVWQGKVQHIQSTVTTNTLVPNPDGFLQGAPLLSGRVTDQSLRSAVRPRYTLGAAYTGKSRDWIGFLSYDFDWRLALGLNQHTGRNQRLWALVFPYPFAWELGYDVGGLSIQFGLSGIDLGSSQRGVLMVGYKLAL